MHDKTIIEAIEAHGYEISESRPYKTIGSKTICFLSLKAPDGKTGFIDMTKRQVSFRFGLETTCIDIVSSYYRLDSEELLLLDKGYGARTAEYLDGYLRLLGVTSYLGTVDWDNVEHPSADSIVREHVNLGGESYTVSKVEGGYLVDVSRQAGVDTFGCTQITFDHDPDDSEIAGMGILLAVERLFSRHSLTHGDIRSEDVRNLVDGSTCHWTELPLSFEDKLICLENGIWDGIAAT